MNVLKCSESKIYNSRYNCAIKKKKEKEAMLFHSGGHSFLQGAHIGNHCFNRYNNSICKKKTSVGTNRLVFGY